MRARASKTNMRAAPPSNCGSVATRARRAGRRVGAAETPARPGNAPAGGRWARTRRAIHLRECAHSSRFERRTAPRTAHQGRTMRRTRTLSYDNERRLGGRGRPARAGRSPARPRAMPMRRGRKTDGERAGSRWRSLRRRYAAGLPPRARGFGGRLCPAALSAPSQCAPARPLRRSAPLSCAADVTPAMRAGPAALRRPHELCARRLNKAARMWFFRGMYCAGMPDVVFCIVKNGDRIPFNMTEDGIYNGRSDKEGIPACA